MKCTWRGGCNKDAEYKLSAGFGTSYRCCKHSDSKYIYSAFYNLEQIVDSGEQK